jgi:O-antigen ligase
MMGPPVVVRRALPLLSWVLPVFASVVLGAAIVRGGTVAALLLAAGAGIGLLVLVNQLGFTALLWWSVATAVAYPFLRFPQGSGLITFDRLWIGAMAVGLAVRVRDVPEAPRTRLLRQCLLALVAVYGLRAVTSPDVNSAVESWIDAVVLPLLLFLFASREVLTRARLQKVLFTLAIAGGVLATMGLAQKYLGLDLASRSGGSTRLDEFIGLVRISGPYPAPEPYDLSLILCLAATLAWMQIKGRSALVVGSTLVALELAGIAFAFFRAGWVCALIVLVAALGLRRRRFGRALVVLVGVGAIAVLTVGQLEQNSTFSTRVNDRSNISGRFATYEQGIAIWKTAPIFGVGVQRFEKAQGNVVTTSVAGVNAVQTAHSSFVNTLGELGAVGFAALMGAIAAIALLIRRFRQLALDRVDVLFGAALVGAALAYTLMSATLTILPYGQANAFLAVLLGVAAGRLNAMESGVEE